MANRTPLDFRYCREVNCSWRSGNKCTLDACARPGNEKRAIYFTKTGTLAQGDVPE